MPDPDPGGDVMMCVFRFRDRFVLCAMLATSAIGPAAAGEDRAPASGTRPAPDPPVRAGLVEGEPTPAAPGDAGIMPSIQRSTEGLQVETLPGGWRRVNLQGRFRAYSVVTIGADGALRLSCADDPVSALGLMSRAHARRPFIGPREE